MELIERPGKQAKTWETEMTDAIVVQVTISALSLKVRTAANKFGQEDVNVFRFAISHPAEGIEEIETVKMIKAGEQLPCNWDDHDLAMVFKTRIRGKCVLKVKALAIDKDSEVERRVRKFFEKALSLAFATWTGGLSNAYVGAVAKASGTTLLTAERADEADVDVLGEGSLGIDSQSLDGEERHRITLSAPKTLVRKLVKKRRIGSRWVRTRMDEEVIQGGTTSGQVEIILTRLN